jgi:hypothetical protein
VLVLAGCASSTDEPEPTTTRLHASVTQHRYAEGTHDLLAGVTNNSGRTVRVSSASIRWRGMDFPTVTAEDPAVPPGETAAFTIRYGAPHCAVAEPGRPTMTAVVDGEAVSLPLHVDMPGLLGQLRAKACEERALDRLASVSLRLARRPSVINGTEMLPGQVVVRRRADETGTVTVDDLGGSVLFAVEPRPGSTALPARMRAGRQRLVVPVVVRSAGRCDAHSRSQSSQTFLFSVFAHRDTGDTQRLVRFPSAEEQQRLLTMLDRVCG